LAFITASCFNELKISVILMNVYRGSVVIFELNICQKQAMRKRFSGRTDERRIKQAAVSCHACLCFSCLKLKKKKIKSSIFLRFFRRNYTRCRITSARLLKPIPKIALADFADKNHQRESALSARDFFHADPPEADKPEADKFCRSAQKD